MNLTWREKDAIRYLRMGLMDARMIGEHIATGNENPIRVGASIMGRLRKKKLVMRLPDLCAWRLSRAGRELADNME